MADAERGSRVDRGAISRAAEWISRGSPRRALRLLAGPAGGASARAMLYRSVARRMLGDCAGADGDLAAARRLDPGDPAVRWAAAARYRQKGLPRLALAECEAAEGLGGATAAWLSMRADLETSLGLPLEAAMTSRRASESAPRDPHLHLRAARRLQEVGFFAGALKEARAARRAGETRSSAALESGLGRFLRSPCVAQPQEPRIGVDPRLELIAVVAALAGRKGLETGFEFEPDSGYGDSARRWFSPLRRHDAVRLYREAVRSGLTAVGAQRSVLLLSPPPRLEPAPEEFPRKAALVEALRDFSERARFGAFFESQEPFYEGLRRAVEEQAVSCRFAALFREYAGRAPAGVYRVILCPLYGRGHRDTLNCVFGPGPESAYRIVSTLGPSGRGRGRLQFDYFGMRWSLWHEMGHALSDHWLENHLDFLKRTGPALTVPSARRYGWWGQVVREHVVQGLATRMEAWAVERGKVPGPRGDGAGKNPLPYLSRIVSRLEEYESRRSRFPTLRSFYPRLLSVFEDLALRLGPSAGAREGRSGQAQSDGLN